MQRANAACCCEGMADISVSLRGRKACLRRRRPNTSQGGHDWKAQMTSQVGRLIEAALAEARGMERHRDRRIGFRDQRPRALPHERRQWSGQRPASFVLQRMDDFSQRAVILADGASAVDLALRSPAARTLTEWQADAPPRRQRVAADVAQRRCEREDRSPTTAAHRPFRRLLEQVTAGGTARGKDDRQNGVEPRTQGGHPAYAVEKHPADLQSSPYRFRFSHSALRLIPRSRAASV